VVSKAVVMRGIACAILALFLVATLTEASTQRYIVFGKFTCGRRPSAGSETSVKLLDKSFGPDTNMGKMKTNADGSFRIDGTSRGVTSIDPELHIYTDCDDGIKPCQRKIKLKLPKKYIGQQNGYDIGIINVETEFKSEERDCWH